MKKNIFDTKIFHPHRTEDNIHRLFNAAVVGVVTEQLLKYLNDRQQSILLKKHYWRPDPSGYIPGKEVSLIERLLVEAGVRFVIFTERWDTINSNLFIYDCKKTTFLEEEDLKLVISEIDKIWKEKKFATIEYRDRHIYFELP